MKTKMENQEQLQINENFCFKPNKDINAALINRALKSYADGFETAVKLEGDSTIFLDTNILLGFYGMSKNQKDKLIEFFKRYKDRIYITKQVEKEYLRNRLSTIDKDFFTPLNEIVKEFEKTSKEIKNKLKEYKDKRKNILAQDFPELWDDVRSIEERICEILDNEEFIQMLQEKVNAVTQVNKNIAIADDLLNLVADMHITDQLSNEERTFVLDLYEKLIVEYNDAKDINKTKFTFPGCGEKKETDKAGDFIIYHEIIKYMKLSGKSCILLTKDITKGDWLQKEKRTPYNHYIENTFFSTNNTLYIIDAEKALEDISFENIHREYEKQTTSNEDVSISTNTITDRNESSVISVKKAEKYGFIYSKEENLYFKDTDVLGDFNDLDKNDIVTFEKGYNVYGQPIAKNVSKVVYSFDNPNFRIIESAVTHIKEENGIGFISHQPENLYFHHTAVEDGFNELQIDTAVEFIIGKNAEGEDIARLVRRKK